MGSYNPREANLGTGVSKLTLEANLGPERVNLKIDVAPPGPERNRKIAAVAEFPFFVF